MTQPKTSRIPAPIYAAAGAGDLALEQLRKLSAAVSDLSGRMTTETGGRSVVTELRQKAAQTLKSANLTAASLREKATASDLDMERLREVANRNAAVVRAGAQAAQERALAAYGALVARGERAVGAGVVEAAETVNADIETTEASIATTTAPALPEATTSPATTETTTTESATAAATEVTTAPAATGGTATPADVAETAEAGPAPVKRTRARKTTTATGTTADTPSAKRAKPAKQNTTD